jgi:hypothetical protein
VRSVRFAAIIRMVEVGELRRRRRRPTAMTDIRSSGTRSRNVVRGCGAGSSPNPPIFEPLLVQNEEPADARVVYRSTNCCGPIMRASLARVGWRRAPSGSLVERTPTEHNNPRPPSTIADRRPAPCLANDSTIARVRPRSLLLLLLGVARRRTVFSFFAVAGLDGAGAAPTSL